ncbi:hypothetical protein BRC81_11040 [Halobacteriales archaeon QS_1_68_20]|nr:MAG: hypothetical protein BRC81_11040 [Halobacteriales archaeon QS_1_68_20]
MVNAFWLDRDLDVVRRWLVDRHVTSSLLECSMVLTTAAQVRGYEGEDLYFTHEDHPLTRWAAESHENWLRLRAYVEAAHEEWRYRWEHDTDRVHGSWATASTVDPSALADLDWPSDGFVDPPQVTGEWGADDYVEAYRLYYANEKRHLFEWTKRERPPWVDDYVREPAAED